MNNNYRFYVEAMTGDAMAKLQEVNKLMDKIESKGAKGTKDFFHTSQKDIDESIADMQKLINLKKQLDSAFEKDVSMFSKSGSMEGVVKARENMESLKGTFSEAQKEFSKLASMKASPNFINNSTLRNQKAFRDELTETEKSLQNIQREMREVNKLGSRVTYRANQAVATGHMNYNQANTFKKDINSVGDLRALQEQNAGRKASLRSQYVGDQNNLTELRQNTTMDAQVRKNRETALYERIRGTEKEIEALNKLDDTIERIVASIEKASQQVESAQVRTAPERGSMLDTLSSRAPSIAMASIGAFMGTFGSLYARGATANASMREPSISIGQRTGNSDFRALKRELQMMGIDRSLGYKGGDMLQFQEDVLGNMGFTNREDLTATTKTLAEGTRAVPVDKETLSNFMNSAMQTGAVSGKDQVKIIQEAFLGAINQSGMVGREKEQLQALSSISQNLFSGRNGNNAELQNALAMQTMLAGTGNRSVQGEAGAQMLNNLNDGLRNGLDNNQLSLIFGRGTKYQGLGGRMELQRQLEKGISDPENMKTLFNYAQTFGGDSLESQKAMFSQMSSQWFGQRLTADQLDGLYEGTNNGNNLTKDKIAEVVKQNNLSGADQYGKNANAYTNSKEATANSSEAVTEKQASEVNENIVGDAIRKANSSLGKVNGTMYALILALGATTTALLTSTAMSAGTGMLKNMTQGVFSSGTATTASASLGGSFLGDIGSAFKTGSKTGGFRGGVSSAFSTARGIGSGGLNTIKSAYSSGGAKGAWGATKDFGSAFFKNGADDVASGVASATKSGGFLSKSGKVLGKMAIPFMVGSELMNIASADDKGRQTGSSIGSIGGALGGGKLGAMIGTAIMPGIGTFIGGALGGLGGGLLGSEAGGWLVDKGRGMWDGIKEFFGGKQANASEVDSVGSQSLTKKTNQSNRQEEKDTASKKVLSEKNRKDNISRESDNLSLYAKLLDRAQRILNIARSQNGIFGNSGGSSGGSSGATAGASGNLSVLGDGKKWTNSNITQHDLGSTVGGLTAEQLDAWIDANAPANSPMRGLGSTFLQAGEESGLDPRYLIAHAALETGWGTSNLSGNGDVKNGNWFGIGAFDNNPNNGFNYSDGIVGGAKWIAENYYKNGQTTLHGMVNDPNGHNYATDPQWADKIASIMSGSDKFTTGSTQTFKTENNVTVNVDGSGGSSTARTVGAETGKAITSALSDSAMFFAKEVKRN